MSGAAELIDALGLVAHPEGGHYRETHRSADQVRRADGQERSAITSIYYLLQPGEYSAWHRIDADEIWNHHAGLGMDVHVLGPAGLVTWRLGDPRERPGAVFQVVVPAGCWFAAELANDGADGAEWAGSNRSAIVQAAGAYADANAYALAGCTVAPGFEFAHFELADASILTQAYPDHAALIRRLVSKGMP